MQLYQDRWLAGLLVVLLQCVITAFVYVIRVVLTAQRSLGYSCQCPHASVMMSGAGIRTCNKIATSTWST